MKPLQVNLPDVSGPGGRKGHNKLVVGIKNGDELQGENLEGDKAEMLPGDLLLSIRPLGKAKDHHNWGVLLYVADDKAENNLRNLVVRTDWPQCKEFIARRCEGLLSGRTQPGQCPECGDAGSIAAVDVPEVEAASDPVMQATLDAREAIIRALELGVSRCELQTILTAAIVAHARKV